MMRSSSYLPYALRPVHWAPLSVDWPIPDCWVESSTSTRGRHQPPLADEEVFVTTRVYVISKLFAHSDNTLLLKRTMSGQFFLDIHPIHPFDASEIPLAHTIQRESSLISARLAESFKWSKSFAHEIQNVGGWLRAWDMYRLSIPNNLELTTFRVTFASTDSSRCRLWKLMELDDEPPWWFDRNKRRHNTVL